MASNSRPNASRPAAPGPKPEAAASTTPTKSRGLVAFFAAKYGIDDERMLTTLKATAFRLKGKNNAPPPEISNEQMFALLSVAKKYDLDPFVREIYAFPTDGGGIVPIVGVDGWLSMINRHPQFDYMEVTGGEESFELRDDEQDLPGPEKFERVIARAFLEVTIKRKDRAKPTVHREYLRETYRDTGPWNSHPHRMLGWKTIIQAGRIAFGYSGIYDEDEAERIAQARSIPGEATDITPRGKPAVTTPQATGGTTPQLTQLPLSEWRAQIDRIGVPEMDVCERFEVGAIDEIPLRAAKEVQEYLDTLERAQAGG
jgi:phage recombination protein Bet